MQLLAVIEISPEYPLRPPSFKLALLQSKENIPPFPREVLAKSDADALKLISTFGFDQNLKVRFVLNELNLIPG